jgi:hypothetical protein
MGSSASSDTGSAAAGDEVHVADDLAAEAPVESGANLLLGELQLLHPRRAAHAHRQHPVAERRRLRARGDGRPHLGAPDAVQLELALRIDALQHVLQCVIDAARRLAWARHGRMTSRAAAAHKSPPGGVEENS